MRGRPIYVAVGANMAGPAGPPHSTFREARRLLERRGIRVVFRSRLYETPPWGGVRQPVFLNAVWQVETGLGAGALLNELLTVERMLGRKRRVRWGPRSLDLDLIDFRGESHDLLHLILPHPRAHLRAFVLAPLAEIAPGWRHPALGTGPAALLARLGPRAWAGLKVSNFPA